MELKLVNMIKNESRLNLKSSCFISKKRSWKKLKCLIFFSIKKNELVLGHFAFIFFSAKEKITASKK